VQIKEVRISKVFRDGRLQTQVVIKARAGSTVASGHGIGDAFEDAREAALSHLNQQFSEVDRWYPTEVEPAGKAPGDPE
jgi:hypothetical protein